MDEEKGGKKLGKFILKKKHVYCFHGWKKKNVLKLYKYIFTTFFFPTTL